MKMSRSMFFAAIAVAIVTSNVNAAQQPLSERFKKQVKADAKNSAALAATVTAAGIIIDEKTGMGSAMRDAGIVGTVAALGGCKVPGVAAAMTTDLVLTPAGSRIAKTEKGKAVGAYVPEALKSNFALYTYRVVAGYVVGRYVDAQLVASSKDGSLRNTNPNPTKL